MNLRMFVPIKKVDAAQRLVYGDAAAEVPDRSGEIFDYATGKVAIKAWSDEALERSAKLGADARSLGNIRYMHSPDAVGKITDISYDDEAQSVPICVKVVDDAAWAKVEAGVLAGFSIGGSYAKRWADPSNPKLMRYTPQIAEISLVDNPCIPTATFQMVKADGVTVEVEVKGGVPVEQPEASLFGFLKGAHGDMTVKALTKAAAEIIAKNRGDHTEAELEALAKAWAPAAREPTAADRLAAAFEKADALALEKAATDPEIAVDTPMNIRAAWSLVNKVNGAADGLEKVKAKIIAAWKDKIDAAGPPSVEKMAAFTGAAITQIVAGLEGKTVVLKGMDTLAWVARLMSEIECLEGCIDFEETMEGDAASKLPAQVRGICQAMAQMVVEMAQEEVAELLGGVDIDAAGLGIDAAEEMSMAATAIDMIKSDTALLEKVGARNSKGDKARIQAVHDHSMALGATCDTGNCDEDEAEKAAKTAELAKSLGVDLEKLADQAAQRIEGLVSASAESNATIASQVEKIAAQETELAEVKTRLEKLERQPMPGRGRFATVEREDDGAADLGKADEVSSEISEIQKMEPGLHKARAVLRLAQGAPTSRGAI